MEIGPNVRKCLIASIQDSCHMNKYPSTLGDSFCSHGVQPWLRIVFCMSYAFLTNWKASSFFNHFTCSHCHGICICTCPMCSVWCRIVSLRVRHQTVPWRGGGGKKRNELTSLSKLVIGVWFDVHCLTTSMRRVKKETILTLVYFSHHVCYNQWVICSSVIYTRTYLCILSISGQSRINNTGSVDHWRASLIASPYSDPWGEWTAGRDCPMFLPLVNFTPDVLSIAAESFTLFKLTPSHISYGQSVQPFTLRFNVFTSFSGCILLYYLHYKQNVPVFFSLKQSIHSSHPPRIFHPFE